MILSEYGNETLSLPEFLALLKDKARELGFEINETEESLRRTYERIRRYHTIYGIRRVCSGAAEGATTDSLLLCVKREARHKYEAWHLRVGKDLPPDAWCTQDCPFDAILVNREEGTVVGNWAEIMEEIRKEKDARDASEGGEQR